MDGAFIQLQLFDLDEDLILLELPSLEFKELCHHDRRVVRGKFIELAVAVMRMAVADAKRGDSEAVDWLKTTGVSWMDDIGIEPTTFIKAVGSLGRKKCRVKRD